MKPTLDELEQRDLLGSATRCANAYGLSLVDTFAPTRQRPAPEARAAFYAHLRDEGWSLPRIGAFVGRHHTTVLSALRAHPTAVEARK